MYYKLTAIKDLPGVESGFSWTFVADMPDDYDLLPLMPRDVSQKVRDKVNILRCNRKHTEFVRTEPDYDRTNKDLLCPVCKEHTLFSYVKGAEQYLNDSGYYKEVGLECGKCGKKICITSVDVGKYYYTP